jgi:hypothetical protein
MSFSTSSLHKTGSDGAPKITYTGGSFAFKPIRPGDFQIRPFKIFKGWFFTSSDATTETASGIQIVKGVKGGEIFVTSSTQNSNGSYQQTVWDGINFLFYETSSEMTERSAHVMFGPVLFSNKKIHNEVTVVSIPQRYYGEGIKPGSISMSDAGHTFVDDGFGNLYATTDSASFAASASEFTVGNAFYEQGLLVVTKTGSFSGSFDIQDFMTSSYELNFNAIHTIYEYETTCIIGQDEFNFTMNPSALSQSVSSSVGQELLTNGEFNDSGSSWNVAGNWTITNGFLQSVGNSTNQSVTQSGITNDPGETYVLNVEVIDNTLAGNALLTLSGSTDALHGVNNISFTASVGFNVVEFTGSSVNSAADKLFLSLISTTTGGVITITTVSLQKKENFTINAPNYLASFVSSSDDTLAPYITTIGLYDDLNNCIAVGKLAKPIKNDPLLPLTFIVRWDM